MTRWRPPHPAKTIHPPTRCPHGQRFNTPSLAHAHTVSLTITGHTATRPKPCNTCGGWHLKEQR